MLGKVELRRIYLLDIYCRVYVRYENRKYLIKRGYIKDYEVTTKGKQYLKQYAHSIIATAIEVGTNTLGKVIFSQSTEIEIKKLLELLDTKELCIYLVHNLDVIRKLAKEVFDEIK